MHKEDHTMLKNTIRSFSNRNFDLMLLTVVKNNNPLENGYNLKCNTCNNTVVITTNLSKIKDFSEFAMGLIEDGFAIRKNDQDNLECFILL